jgi:hypothetical protein
LGKLLLITKRIFIKPASPKGDAENLEKSKQIHLTTTIMKMQDLNEQELMEINGGGLLNILGLNLGGLGGNSGTGGSQSGLSGGLNIGSLLSITNTNQSGSSTSISLGNNIGLSLQQLTNSIFN